MMIFPWEDKNSNEQNEEYDSLRKKEKDYKV